MEIIDSIWFSQMGNKNIIGIVKVKNETGEEKCYIGSAPGILKKEDEKYIANTGAKFPYNIF